MGKCINLSGKKFGRLIAIKQDSRDKQNHIKWLCDCECGKSKSVRGYDLVNGKTRSCGCFLKESSRKRGKNNIKHGHKRNNRPTIIYSKWQGILQRCTNPNDKDFYRWGGRGIKVCKRWLEFKNFLKDMGEPPTNKYQIDRINNNGHYCKKNCRWATHQEQQRNTSKNILITFNNQTKLLIIWSEEFGIKYQTLWARIFRRGWSTKRALTEPVNHERKKNELLPM